MVRKKKGRSELNRKVDEKVFGGWVAKKEENRSMGFLEAFQGYAFDQPFPTDNVTRFCYGSFPPVHAISSPVPKQS